MTTLLEQAFTAATKLSQEEQDELAQLILQEISRQQHQQVNKVTTQKSPLQIFTELGLVGCFEGESDLSDNYKSVVKSYILKKHDHH
jgi:hypothetical protein